MCCENYVEFNTMSYHLQALRRNERKFPESTAPVVDCNLRTMSAQLTVGIRTESLKDGKVKKERTNAIGYFLAENDGLKNRTKNEDFLAH